MAEGKTPRANRTSIIDKKPKTPITMQRRLTREPSPQQKEKKSPRVIFSQSQKRTKPYGILGIDTLKEDEKMGAYKALTQQKGGKMSVVTREFTYGIDEKLYTSETEREKLKNKFNTFMKKVDQDIKSTDAYLADLTAHKKAKTMTL